MIVHGGDIYSVIAQTGIPPLDYSANINPLGLPEPVKRAIIENIDSYSAYPDVLCRGLKKAVGCFESIDESFLLFGNGAADIIFKIAYALKPESALLLAPTFAEYEAALRNTGCKINYHRLNEHDGFKVSEAILNSIDDIDGLGAVFLCNPNNPTGMVAEKQLMRKIAEKCKSIGAFLVLDECFMDFVENNDLYEFKEYLEEFDNVIVLKAFTKIFSMAGLRLGYCLCSNPHVLAAINNSGQPWSVSGPAQAAGIAACSETDHIKKTVRIISEERDFLCRGLRKAGYKVFNSVANYILIKSHENLYEKLLKEHIIIRRCSNYVGLDDTYFRVAVKCREDNEKLLKAINTDGGINNG